MLLGTGLASLVQEVPEPQSLESPLPGGFATVVRFFLNFPQALQIAGVLVAGILTAVGAVLVWRHRRRLVRWVTGLPRVVHAIAGGVAVVALVGGVWAGFSGWHYVQHDNGFCTGCHVMGPAFVRFTESEHSQLECHDCHRQSVVASMRQLYLWVADRPEDIGAHSPVPTGICAECHIGEGPTANERWERIVTTQGHALHLDSRHEDLADVQCVTCHSTEVHRFVPAEETCAQSGCHLPEETRIALGEMGSQTTLHCLGCHEFTAQVAGGGPSPLFPTAQSCDGCHDHEEVWLTLASNVDPHEGVCASCHDPHTQEEAAAAVRTCTGAGCHDGNLTALTPFHRGLNHGVIDDCSVCHKAHDFVVDGEDCTACHVDLR